MEFGASRRFCLLSFLKHLCIPLFHLLISVATRKSGKEAIYHPWVCSLLGISHSVWDLWKWNKKAARPLFKEISENQLRKEQEKKPHTTPVKPSHKSGLISEESKSKVQFPKMQHRGFFLNRHLP